MIEIVKLFTKKINLFIVLQIVWLVEFYVLAIWAAAGPVAEIIGDGVQKPTWMVACGETLLNMFDMHSASILYLAIVAFVAGVCGECFRHIWWLNEYRVICLYSDFGLYAGGWLFLIWGTYELYKLSGAWFLAIPFLCAGGSYAKERAREWLEEKGVEFG